MNRWKPSRPGIRSLVAGLAAALTLLAASAPLASAHEASARGPGHLPAGHHTSGRHPVAPGHAGHIGAPGH